jgi:hypothetical protein
MNLTFSPREGVAAKIPVSLLPPTLLMIDGSTSKPFLARGPGNGCAEGESFG